MYQIWLTRSQPTTGRSWRQPAWGKEIMVRVTIFMTFLSVHFYMCIFILRCRHQVFYQMSVALETGVWLTISGAMNSGVPYLQYCPSPGVNFTAFPKSQIRIWSLEWSAMRMLSGYESKVGRIKKKKKKKKMNFIYM